MDILALFLGANLVELLMRIMFLILGAMVMYVLFPLLGAATRILYCRERDGRGMDLAVKLEDEVRLDTKNNIRFFKHGRSYAFTGMMNRLKSVFFAKEGSAYTAKLMGFSGHPRGVNEESVANAEAAEAEAAEAIEAEQEAAKIAEGKGATDKDRSHAVWTAENAEKAHTAALAARSVVTAEEAGPTQIDLEFPTVWEAVRLKLGDDFLKPFPEEQKKLLQDEKFLVTVDLEPGLTPEGYKPATEQDIADKGKRDMAKLLGEAAKMALHGGMIDKVPWIGMGVAIGLVGAMALGWIPVASSVVG